MHEHHIRHLPVLNGGRLVGMITERDIALVEGLKGVDVEALTVEEAMSTQTYSVSPDAPLDEIAREMASKKFGSAVVEQNHKIVGIITTVDICQALADLLHGRLAK
jgi:acetoin utilization protein AcuB